MDKAALAAVRTLEERGPRRAHPTTSRPRRAPFAATVISRPAPPGDLIRDDNFTPAGVEALFELAAEVKARPRRFARGLAGRAVAVLFEKRSLRTRLTFELGIKTLGGESVFMDTAPQRIPDREPIADVARNLERWVDGVVLRTFSHATVEEFARWSRIPIINGLSELFHPCQALTDFFTLREKVGHTAGAKLAFVGDGNNVAHSLLLTGALCGAHVAMANPAAYQPKPELVAAARQIAAQTRARIELYPDDPGRAVEDAQAVYTDVWASMGFEQEAAERSPVFAPFQVTPELLERAAPACVFMHCLPAHRGEEVVEAVIESPRSVVFEQAENRLHVAKAILLTLLGN